MRKIIISLFIASTGISACTGEGEVQEVMNEKRSESLQASEDSMAVAEIESTETVIFRTDTVSGLEIPGWGYDIYVNGKKMIHQPHIPAVPGRQVFTSEEEAGKVASLVSFKILNNIMPPSVTTSELDSLSIAYE